jgi:hypothetical protein
LAVSIDWLGSQPPCLKVLGLGYPRGWIDRSDAREIVEISKQPSDGASRTRTGDLLGAIQALFQLSYSPEGEVGRIVPGASQGEG